MTQPLYSPDLVPYGFWLFPKLKSPLKVWRAVKAGVIQPEPAGVKKLEIVNHKLQLNAAVTFAEEIFII